MNKYFNPSNEEYKALCEKPYYVDKTYLISEFNNVKYSDDEKVSAFLPIGFGKTSILDMVTAFYSKGCDSRALFENKKIAETPNWDEHLNKYDVFRINMKEVINSLGNDYLTRKLDNIFESALKNKYPEIENSRYFFDGITLREIYKKTGDKFIIIIDDYHCVYLKKDCQKYIESYDTFLNYLVGYYSIFVEKCFVFGVIEGIHDDLEIRCHMRNIDLREGLYFNGAVGFKEAEVKELCQKFNMDFNKIEDFFGAYQVGKDKFNKVYNANSIVTLIRDFNCDLDLYKNKDFLDNSLKKLLLLNNDVYEKDNSSFLELVSIDNFKTLRLRGIYRHLFLFMKSKIVTFEHSTFYFYLDDSTEMVSTFFELLSYFGYVNEILNYHEGSTYSTCDYVIPNKEMEKTLEVTLNEIPEYRILNETSKNSREFFNKIIELDSEYIENAIKKIGDSIRDVLGHKHSFVDLLNIIFDSCSKDYNFLIENYEVSIGAFLSPKEESSLFFNSIRPYIIFDISYSPTKISENNLINYSKIFFTSHIKNIKPLSNFGNKTKEYILINVNIYGEIEDNNTFDDYEISVYINKFVEIVKKSED